MPELEIYLLGPPRIWRGGQVVEMDTRKAVALLAYLALSGTPQSRDGLAAFLWPDFDESRARAALRRTLSTLKRGIGPAFLDIARDNLGLVSRPGLWLDVRVFQAGVAAVRSHAHDDAGLCPRCVSALKSAAALFEDDFLAGFSLRDSFPFDEWQRQQAESLAREMDRVLDWLVQALAARHDFEPALAHAHRWLDRDPLREAAYRQLMRLYAWTGRRDAALRLYQDCQRVLDEELGVAPLKETTELYEAVLAGRLALPAAVGPLLPPVAPEAPPATGGSIEPLPRVGREPALAALRQAYERVGAAGYLMAVVGEAGIGKTRLAEGFLAELAGTGAATLAARCFPGEANLAYGPIVQALREALAGPAGDEAVARLAAPWKAEAARLLPELAERWPDLAPPPPLDGPGAQIRFYTGLSQLLDGLVAGDRAGVLFLDDLHWADRATLDLVAFLARRLQHHRWLILLTWQEEELGADPQLPGLLAEVRRRGLGERLLLPRLEQADVTRLLAASEVATAEPIGARLFQETEGLPYFVVEYLAALTQAGGDWTMPANVRALLQARLAGVGEPPRQLLQAAATIGRDFSYELLQAVSGRSEEETVNGLETLLAHGLVKERGDEPTPYYDFTHDKFRVLVRDETSLVRRRLLHRRLALALAEQARREPQPAALAGRIAEHWRWAGAESPAADYFRQAGDYARAVYAPEKALAHYEQALALGHPESAALHEAIGDMHTLQGAYARALRHYELARALADPAEQARLEHRIGQVHSRLGDWERAAYHLAAATAGHDETPAGDQATLCLDRSYVAFRRDDLARAGSLAQEAVGLAEASGDRAALAQAHNVLGMLAHHQGQLDPALEYLTAARHLATEAGRLDLQVAALNNLALVQATRANLGAAARCLDEALEHCLTLGDRHREAALHNNRADVLHRLGRPDEAMAALRQSVAIYAEIGRDGDQWQPGVWKLREW